MAIPLPVFNPNDFDVGPADWARAYRQCGWQVIPGYAPGETPNWKRPMLSEWRTLQEQLVPDETFTRWYGLTAGEHRRRPNMGLLTGRCSGNQFVVDLDTHKHPQAAKWWRALLVIHNNSMELETVEQQTGGGGRQKIFQAPADWVAPTNKTAIGVDVRGQGGFAVLPPSRHDSGASYQWLPGFAPWEHEVAEAPQWLLEAIERLIVDHGGAAAAPRGPVNRGLLAGGPSAAQYDDFRQQIDGRETLMRDMVHASILNWYRESPIEPTYAMSRQRSEQEYEVYERQVAPQRQHPPGTTKREALEIEGRGYAEWWSKWHHLMGRWDTDVAERAKVPNPNVQPDPGPAIPPISGPAKLVPVRPAFRIDATKIPVRAWVVPGLLLRGSLSVLVAPPGSGKSLLTLQMAIAVAAGVSWGGFAPRSRQKVLIINAEDDLDEMQRRLVVAAKEMCVPQDDLVGWLDLVEAPESIVIAKIDGRSKAVVRKPLVDDLIKTIVDGGYGLVVADPFAETFEGDENSNSEVKWAGVLWREVARKGSCALWLVHHTKKYAGGMAGDADASRGGGAMIGIARVLVTLFVMTEDEAEAMGVDVDDRLDYVRLDDGKANYSKLGKVRWFEKVTREVGNAQGLLPSDEVGVLLPWKPPGALDGISVLQLNQALDAIDRGVLDEAGQPSGAWWSPEQNAKSRWVGALLMTRLNCPKKAAAGLVKLWLKHGTLVTFEYQDPVQRKPRTGCKSDPTKRPGEVSFED